MLIRKSEIITIPVTDVNVLQYYLPDNAILRTAGQQKVYTQGIEFFPQEVVAKAPDGTTNMSSIDLRKGYLYLYIKEGEYYKMPISRMVSTFLNTVTAAAAENYPHVFELAELDDLDINFSKSYIKFPAALAAATVTIVFAVYYDFYTRSKPNNDPYNRF